MEKLPFLQVIYLQCTGSTYVTTYYTSTYLVAMLLRNSFQTFPFNLSILSTIVFDDVTFFLEYSTVQYFYPPY